MNPLIASVFALIIIVMMMVWVYQGVIQKETKVNYAALIIFTTVSCAWAGSVLYSWINPEYNVPDALYNLMGSIAGIAMRMSVSEGVSNE